MEKMKPIYIRTINIQTPFKKVFPKMDNFLFSGCDWTDRAKVCASYITPKTSVLDLGSGEQPLKRFIDIKKGHYQPVDKFPVTEDTIVCNFNKGDFPQFTKKFGYVTCLGLIEYIPNKKWLFDQLHQYSDRLVVTFMKTKKQVNTWVEDLKHWEVEKMLDESGWEIRRTSHVSCERIYLCVSSKNLKNNSIKDEEQNN